jgi:uncharacterized membrane protein
VADFTSTSLLLGRFAEWIHLILEGVGIIVIAAGAVASFLTIVRHVRAHQRVAFTATRLELARYLAFALELQLAADLVESAISPSWERLGQLAAIATIRTALNYFLGREMRDERNTLQHQDEATPTVPTGP